MMNFQSWYELMYWNHWSLKSNSHHHMFNSYVIDMSLTYTQFKFSRHCQSHPGIVSGKLYARNRWNSVTRLATCSFHQKFGRFLTNQLWWSECSTVAGAERRKRPGRPRKTATQLSAFLSPTQPIRTCVQNIDSASVGTQHQVRRWICRHFWLWSRFLSATTSEPQDDDSCDFCHWDATSYNISDSDSSNFINQLRVTGSENIWQNEWQWMSLSLLASNSMSIGMDIASLALQEEGRDSVNEGAHRMPQIGNVHRAAVAEADPQLPMHKLPTGF